MRLGVAWEPSSNANYRAVFPLREMVSRGHEVLWQTDADTAAHVQWLAGQGCDVVHLFRTANIHVRQGLQQVVARGGAIVYDNDDDFTAVPKESPLYAQTGGLKGQDIFRQTVKAARMARVFTTTTEVLAERYRRAGVDRVEVIANHLAPGPDRMRRSHDGLVIGWIAGVEHRADANRLRVAQALRQVLGRHAHVRVESIGVNLGLSERYVHDSQVNFDDLPARVGGFDIGIAPLADIAWNRARSDIKLKEYAASGVSWLASPVGPYRGLGPGEGGLLVPDDGWVEALDQLIRSPRARDELGRAGQAWAARNTMTAIADRWEHVFGEAAGQDVSRARHRRIVVNGASLTVRVGKR